MGNANHFESQHSCLMCSGLPVSSGVPTGVGSKKPRPDFQLLRLRLHVDVACMVVTTNLDVQRTAIWDMGKIAASDGPGALDLFRNVLTASASIPGVFSPMLIDVDVDGRHSAEMHVDGGVTTNVLILPEAVLVSGTPVFPPDARPKVYVILNGKLAPDFELVKASTLQIVRRSFETSVRANTRNTLIAFYQFAKSRNWDFNLASINADYPKSDAIGFDLIYMHQLFEYGYQRGQAGIHWQSTPAAPPPSR
jgi:hypothetical protein